MSTKWLVFWLLVTVVALCAWCEYDPGEAERVAEVVTAAKREGMVRGYREGVKAGVFLVMRNGGDTGVPLTNILAQAEWMLTGGKSGMAVGATK
ncbi:MAG: hypothetical protein GY851_26550 [bacterium]|nr:hypothetical protein [bacterium]